jgi:hypothetical protein
VRIDGTLKGSLRAAFFYPLFIGVIKKIGADSVGVYLFFNKKVSEKQ